MNEIFRVNNFDIIRLIAALQVAITHTNWFLDIERGSSIFINALTLFPGVPIFFFVSGFLISRSYENNSALEKYARNRILRIYPALIACTFITVVSVYMTGYMHSKSISIGELTIWIIGQVSIVQFYAPDFIRAFGTGTFNGSLWTITVELQFYILVPILYWIFGLAKPSKSNVKILFLILFFMVFHINRASILDNYGNYLLFKHFGVSFFPWIYMFLVGVFFQRNFSLFYRFLSGKVLYILPFYLILSYILVKHFGWGVGNGINPILYLLLSVLVFSFAYSYPTLSKSVLRGNDISYGIYIYHIPIINILIFYGLVSNMFYASIAIIGTILIAIFSWLVIEKNSIKFKRHPLNPLV